MKKRGTLVAAMIGIIGGLLLPSSPMSFGSERQIPAWIQLVTDEEMERQSGGTYPNILVELFLAREQKKNLPTIKEAFSAFSITRIRSQFFRLGHPPKNIAIGKNVPAPVARLALRLAVEYNGGVTLLLPQFRFFPEHIAIGTSAFDESSQIPIRPEDLERLREPSLSDEEFHQVYRFLTGEIDKLPTYLDDPEEQSG